jgi:hypothetical protein
MWAARVSTPGPDRGTSISAPFRCASSTTAATRSVAPPASVSRAPRPARRRREPVRDRTASRGDRCPTAPRTSAGSIDAYERGLATRVSIGIA